MQPQAIGDPINDNALVDPTGFDTFDVLQRIGDGPDQRTLTANRAQARRCQTGEADLSHRGGARRHSRTHLHTADVWEDLALHRER